MAVVAGQFGLAVSNGNPFVLVKGFFAITVVKDRGQPSWDYRPVEDIPGESAYAIYDASHQPQHIKGKGGE